MLASIIRHRIQSTSSLVSRHNLSTNASPKPFNSIPGPKPIPFLGNVKELKEIMKGNAGEDNHFHQLANKYGDLYRLCMIGSLSQSLIVVSNANLIGQVIKNEGKYPVRNTHLELGVLKWIHNKNNMPTGMFMAHKNDWKRLRSSMTKQVTPRRLEHFTPGISTVVDDLCNHINAKRDNNGWMGDIWYPLQMWAVKGITKIVFGEDIDTFSKENKQAADFISAIQSFLVSLDKILWVPPLYKIYPTKSYKQYVTSFNKVRSIGKELLNNHYEQLLLADIEAGTVDEDSAIGLLDQWLIEGKLSEDEAVVQACDMLFAGVDTTSSSATFMLHEIAKNPEVQNTVFEEIMEVVGPYDSPTPKHLQKLSLVRKCVKETLRMYPLVPANSREVEKDCVLMGYQIPARTICVFNFESISVKNSHYFKDPLKFNPERWSHETKDIHPYASLPFGFGPRSCYGRRIAELELHLLLTRILQRFELSTNQEAVKLIIQTTLRPNESVGIKFADRQLK